MVLASFSQLSLLLIWTYYFKNDIGQNLKKVLFIEAIILSIPLIFAVLFFRNKPNNPPSVSAMKRDEHKEKYFLSILNLVKQKDLMLSLISFSICIGLTYTILALDQQFLPSTYSQIKVGIVGVTFIGVGIAFGLMGTVYTETKADLGNFDFILKCFIGFAGLALLLLSVFINSDNDPAIFILTGATGFGLIAFIPFATQSLAESGYPIKETLIVNALFFLAQIVGLIGNSVASASFVGDQGMWVLVVIIFPAEIYVLFFFKTNFKRRVLESSKNQYTAAQTTEAMLTIPGSERIDLAQVQMTQKTTE